MNKAWPWRQRARIAGISFFVGSGRESIGDGQRRKAVFRYSFGPLHHRGCCYPKPKASLFQGQHSGKTAQRCWAASHSHGKARTRPGESGAFSGVHSKPWRTLQPDQAASGIQPAQAWTRR
jgi:hypothetical protein